MVKSRLVLLFYLKYLYSFSILPTVSRILPVVHCNPTPLYWNKGGGFDFTQTHCFKILVKIAKIRKFHKDRQKYIIIHWNGHPETIGYATNVRLKNRHTAGDKLCGQISVCIWILTSDNQGYILIYKGLGYYCYRGPCSHNKDKNAF